MYSYFTHTFYLCLYMSENCIKCPQGYWKSLLLFHNVKALIHLLVDFNFWTFAKSPNWSPCQSFLLYSTDNNKRINALIVTCTWPLWSAWMSHLDWRNHSLIVVESGSPELYVYVYTTTLTCIYRPLAPTTAVSFFLADSQTLRSSIHPFYNCQRYWGNAIVRC